MIKWLLQSPRTMTEGRGECNRVKIKYTHKIPTHCTFTLLAPVCVNMLSKTCALTVI